MALVYQVPQGFADRTKQGLGGLDAWARLVWLPSQAKLRALAVEARDGQVHAASWSFTLPLAKPIGRGFYDELARGIVAAAASTPSADVRLRDKQRLPVQEADGGRVDIDETVDGRRMREIIFYAPDDHSIAFFTLLCPLDELARYQPRFVAAVQGHAGEERPPWQSALELSAALAFVAGVLAARAARKQLERATATGAGSAPSRSG